MKVCVVAMDVQGYVEAQVKDAVEERSRSTRRREQQGQVAIDTYKDVDEIDL